MSYQDRYVVKPYEGYVKLNFVPVLSGMAEYREIRAEYERVFPRLTIEITRNKAEATALPMWHADALVSVLNCNGGAFDVFNR